MRGKLEHDPLVVSCLNRSWFNHRCFKTAVQSWNVQQFFRTANVWYPLSSRKTNKSWWWSTVKYNETIWNGRDPVPVGQIKQRNYDIYLSTGGGVVHQDINTYVTCEYERNILKVSMANSNLEIRLNKKKPCLKLETGGKNSVLNQPLNVISFRYPSWHEFLNHPHYPGWSLFHSWITWAAYASILFDLSHIWCKLALSCAQSMFMASALVNKSPKYLKITNPCIFSGQNPYNENPKRATISWEITGSHITNSSPFVISRSWQCMWLLLHGTSCHQNQSKRPKRRLCQKGIIKTFPLELRHIKHCKMFLDLQLEKINKNLEKNMFSHVSWFQKTKQNCSIFPSVDGFLAPPSAWSCLIHPIHPSRFHRKPVQGNGFLI